MKLEGNTLFTHYNFKTLATTNKNKHLLQSFPNIYENLGLMSACRLLLQFRSSIKITTVFVKIHDG